MPAGCDFTCKNEECEQCDSGIVITAPWPLGKIELIINAPNVKEKEEFREGLIKMKNDGAKFACITYPNVAYLDTFGYRVQLWCPSCPCIWNYDVMLTEECTTFEEAYAKAKEEGDIPFVCPKCEEDLMEYDDVLEEGIPCPFCKDELQQNRWMAKEVCKESTYKGN